MPAGQKIRVLIVDDIAETRENVRKLLQFESDFEVVGAAKSGKEALELTWELAPDVVLMDINMPDMDGIAATEAIRQKMPFVQVIILSVQGDPHYMRRAMLAGARDFLTKPPMGDELTSAIRRAGEIAFQERAKSAHIPVASAPGLQMPVPQMTVSQGKVITVYSPKGGTGRTTVAVNLAIALHNEETRTVIVDGNLQFGDVAVFLNEQGKNSIVDIAPRVDELDPDIVDGIMVRHAASGVHVLAAPVRPEQAESVTGEQFSKLLNYLRQMYAYIIVDTPSSLNDITLAAIDTSEIIVLLTTQDIPTIKNVRLFLDVLNSLGIQRDRILFAMNRYDKRIAITPEKIGENLKQPVVAVIPLDERTVIPAVNRGVPFMVDNKTQPVSRSILALAESLRSQLAAMEASNR
ncbi:MAG: response regulator [Candidatus Villigracilaceae bacterium]